MVKEVKEFFKEHKQNKKYIFKLAYASAKADTEKTTLGMWWNVFRDAVFFVAYGFFMIAIRGGKDGHIDGMPTLMYLFTGLTAWYLINDTLGTGVNCIIRNKHIFSKIKFPILVIPTFETLALFIKRFSTFIMLAVVLIFLSWFDKFGLNINIFGLLYSVFASFIFGVVYSLFMSGFYTISRDFRELYKAIVRILFYFMPIFWSATNDLPRLLHSETLAHILNKTPFYHLINSFRNAICLGKFPPLSEIGVFAIFVIILFLLGCYIQYRLRRIYADFV